MLIFKQVIFLLSFLFSSLALATQTNSISIQDVTNKTSSNIEKMDLEKERIRDLQKKLTRDGYYLGPINGEKTAETRRAIKNWATDRD